MQQRVNATLIQGSQHRLAGEVDIKSYAQLRGANTVVSPEWGPVIALGPFSEPWD